LFIGRKPLPEPEKKKLKYKVYNNYNKEDTFSKIISPTNQ